MLTRHTRREILAALSSLGALSALPGCAGAGPVVPLRTIPRSTERLSAIGLGSTKPVRLISTVGTDPLESVIRMLISYGGNVIDTSPRPAELDAVFGRLLQQPDFRNSLFVATKVKTEGKEAGIAQIRQTQKLFGREELDLVQIESLLDLETHWPTLRDFKDRGHIRHIGVTVAHERLYPTLEAFMKRELPDFVQLNFSVIEHSAEQRLLPLAADMGIAILINGPFMNGDYFKLVNGKSLPDWAAEFDCESWGQFSLKYILAHPAVTSVLTETTKPHHMEDNLRAALGRLPDAATKARMREFAQSI